MINEPSSTVVWHGLSCWWDPRQGTTCWFFFSSNRSDFQNGKLNWEYRVHWREWRSSGLSIPSLCDLGFLIKKVHGIGAFQVGYIGGKDLSLVKVHIWVKVEGRRRRRAAGRDYLAIPCSQNSQKGSKAEGRTEKLRSIIETPSEHMLRPMQTPTFTTTEQRRKQQFPLSTPTPRLLLRVREAE